MNRYFPIVLIILLAFLLLGCSPATPTVSGEYHPLTERTGIDEIDNIIDAVASGDIQSVRSLLQFTNTKCTQAEGMGGPPKCREGEAEGTSVEVLPILGPEGHFIHKENIEEWMGVPADGLYAVYEVAPDVVSDSDYPPGKYAVMFVDQANQAVISLHIEDGKIVRVDYIFDNSPDIVNGWIEREASKIILAPER